MKFQRIEIENFASYYGKNPPINLKTTADKPLVIFYGGTGFGKTSLFDGINWALYGQEYEKDLADKKDRSIADYVHETALREAHLSGGRVQMSVTLYFEHESGDNGSSLSEYYITQAISVKPVKDKDGFKAEIVSRSTHLREIMHSGDHEEIPYNKTFLDELLPNNVKSYFLFDGDRIHNLAKPGNSQEVQEAIYRVVDLEIIRNAAEHLQEAAFDFGKKAAKSATGHLAKLEDEYNNELQFQNSLKSRISEIKKERQAIKDQIERIDEKLKDLPETKALQERRSQFNKELGLNEQQQKEVKNRIRDRSARASLSLVFQPMKELRDLLHDKRTKGEIPKHIRETFFKDLFAIQECICGTTFESKAGDLIYETLKKRLDQEKDRSQEEDNLIDLYHALAQAETLILDARQSIIEDDSFISELEKEEKSLLYQKQEIEKQLEQLPIEDINKLVTEQKKRHERDRELIADFTTKQDQLTNSDKELKRLEDERRELGKKHQEAGALHLRSDLSKKSADLLNTLYDTFAEESRQAVEKLTIEEFKKFVFSSSGYSVRLSNEYSLEVLDSNGNRALQRLSMGQSQCLSLAFITAISRVSKKQPPLVIDMPLGRLDSDVHEAISKRLPHLGDQIILFLIPGVEWNNITKSILLNHTNYLYEMQFDPNNKQTSLLQIQ